MNMFLVKGRVERSEYMSSSREFDDIRLVKADSMEEAKLKYVLYWSDKSSSYSYSHFVLSCEVLETVQ
jgi:hypothetical protein